MSQQQNDTPRLDDDSDLALEEALDALIDLAEDDPAAALSMYTTLPDEVQQQPAFRFEKAVLLRETDDLAQAREILQELLVALPDDSDAHHLLADVLEDLDEEELALTHFLRTLELDRSEFEEVPREDRDLLKTQVETCLQRVLETMPSPFKEALAQATFKLSALPTEELVRAGLDPRSAMHHDGEVEVTAESTLLVHGPLLLFFGNLQAQGQFDDEDDLALALEQCIEDELIELFEVAESELAP